MATKTTPRPPRRRRSTAPAVNEPLWWYADLLRRLRPAGARLLQVECGDGRLLGHLADHFEVFGFDIRPSARNRCRMQVPEALVLEEWEHRPEDGFDVVVSIGAFGLRGARAQVRGLLPTVAPGGALVMIVPNPSGWGCRLKGEGWYDRWSAQGEALLSMGEWHTILRSFGLEMVATHGDGLWDGAYVPVVPEAVQTRIFSAALTVRRMLPIPAAWSPVRFGERMILVAERKLQE